MQASRVNESEKGDSNNLAERAILDDDSINNERVNDQESINQTERPNGL